MQLTIGIGTHNSENTVKECLDSIVPEVEKSKEEVEILIIDNASKDNSWNIIKEYSEKYNFIRVYKNKKNIGADKNYNLLVVKAKGKFVWFFSDDDKVKRGVVKKILKVIKEHLLLGHIFINWGGWNETLKKCKVERTIDREDDILFLSAAHYLSVVKLNSTLLASIVINRLAWKYAPTEQFIDSDWHHYAKIQEIIKVSNSYFIAKPYVMYRGISGGRFEKNSERSLKQMIRLINIIKFYKKKNNIKEEYNNIIKIPLRVLPVEIINLKLKGLRMRNMHILKFMITFKRYIYFWFVCFPIMCVPYIFYIPFKSIIRKVIPDG